MPIKLKTSVPGPISKSLLERRAQNVARGPFHATPVFAKSAKGANIEDVDGNVYIDFASGIGVVNVGHCADEVVAAIHTQADQALHLTSVPSLSMAFLSMSTLHIYPLSYHTSPACRTTRQLSENRYAFIPCILVLNTVYV